MNATHEESPLGGLDAVGIARLVDDPEKWREVLAIKKEWKGEHPDRARGPDICTTALVNPSACQADEADWANLRPMLAADTADSYFGFCATCVQKIEAAGLMVLPGSFKEAVQAVTRRREAPAPRYTPRRDAPITAAPAPIATPPTAPSTNPFAGKSKRELARLRGLLTSSLKGGLITEAECQHKLALLGLAELEAQEAELRERRAAFEQTLGVNARMDAIRHVALPSVGPEQIAGTVRRAQDVMAGSEGTQPTPIRRRKMRPVPCNMNSAITGNPLERNVEMPEFDEEDFPSAEACFQALGATRGRYEELMRAHADDPEDPEAIRDTQGEARQAAKATAKECRLHGPEFSTLGRYRYQLVELVKRRWPDRWKDKPAGTAAKNGNGHNHAATPPPAASGPGAAKLGSLLKCAECEARGTQLYWRGDGSVTREEGPNALCAKCYRRGKKDRNRDKRETARVKRREDDRKRYDAVQALPRPGQQEGHHKKSKKGGGKGGRK